MRQRKSWSCRGADTNPLVESVDLGQFWLGRTAAARQANNSVGCTRACTTHAKS
jgi:hypothetical protein